MYAMAGAAFHFLFLVGCSEKSTAPATPQAVEAGPVDTPRPQGDERLVLAFGDSLYAGYGLENSESLPARLEARLRKAGVNATVVNAGVSGDTTAAGHVEIDPAQDVGGALARAEGEGDIAGMNHHINHRFGHGQGIANGKENAELCDGRSGRPLPFPCRLLG